MSTQQYLALTLPLCALLLAGGLVVCAHWRPEQPDLRWMAAAFALFSVGVGGQIVQIPAGLDDSAAVSAACYHLCAMCIAQAMACRWKVLLPWGSATLVAVGAWATLLYFTYVDYNLFARIVVLNVGLGLQLAVGGWWVWQQPPTGKVERALWWLYGVFVASFGVRTLLSLPSSEGLDDANFGDTPFWMLLYVSMVVFAVLWALMYLAAAVTAAHAQLHWERNTDSLTQLLNRRAFEEVVRSSGAAHDALGTLVLVDVDHFKAINDRWGHAVGDTVLHQVAQVLREGVRSTDVVARYGGEEFVLLLRDTPLAGAMQVLERMQQQLALTRYAGLPDAVRVTLSGGAVHLAQPVQLDLALAQADRLLYQAKQSGRNRLMWSTLDAAVVPSHALV